MGGLGREWRLPEKYRAGQRRHRCSKTKIRQRHILHGEGYKLSGSLLRDKGYLKPDGVQNERQVQSAASTIKQLESEMSELLEFFRTETVGAAAETLDFWLNECSLDEAPSAEEVAQWQAVLDERGGRFVRLAMMCADWLEEHGA